MRFDRTIVRELRELESRLLPPVAELGAVAFTATAFFAVIAAVAEFFQPGFVVNYVSPRAIAAAAVLSGALSLLGRRAPEARSRRQRLTYAAVGVLAVFSSFGAAWYYFQSVPEVRTRLSLVAALIIAALFWLSGRSEGGDGREI